MAKRIVLSVLFVGMLATPAGADDTARWACSTEMPVYAHDLDPLTASRVKVALRHLSEATGDHWYLAGDTADNPADRAYPSDWPARIITTTSSLSAQWRGNTTIWAGTNMVAADTVLNLYRLQGRAQTMKTLLHELAHMAGVEHHSLDPASPLYAGTIEHPATNYTVQDRADLASVSC